jgi:hypothetical protein
MMDIRDGEPAGVSALSWAFTTIRHRLLASALPRRRSGTDRGRQTASQRITGGLLSHRRGEGWPSRFLLASRTRRPLIEAIPAVHWSVRRRSALVRGGKATSLRRQALVLRSWIKSAGSLVAIQPEVAASSEAATSCLLASRKLAG